MQIKITHIKINLTNVSKKINIKVPEQIKLTPIPIKITNKVPRQIKTYNIEKYKKEHRKKFNKVLILLDEYNTMQEHAYNMHKKAFNKVLMQIKLNKKVPIANNAGYKDSSANIELTKETIVPTFNKIDNIKRALSKYIDDTHVPLNELYDDKLIKLNELKRVNNESNKGSMHVIILTILSHAHKITKLKID